jgi:drug/metabolite transporter (DMT)-like permease
MSSAVLLAIGSAILYGAGDFTGGLTTRRASTIPVVVFSQASGLVLLALLLPFLPDASPSRQDWLWGASAGLFGGVGVALLYRALAIGTMSIVAPTTAVCAVTIPVFAAILLGERPSTLAVAGIVVGILSILLVSLQSPGPADSRPARGGRAGLGTALASGVAIGFFLLSFAQTGPAAGMWPLLAARLVSVSLFGLMALGGGHRLGMPRNVFLLVVVAGILDMLANALYLLAVRIGPLSVVATLSSLYPASTVLLARIVLGERLNLWQMSGVVCALAAVVLIVRGGG